MIRLLSGIKYSKAKPPESGLIQASIRSLGTFIKRIFDFIFAGLGLILVSPFFAYIVHRLKLDSPGPAFYWGPRSGKGGRVFNMLKFRTMYECEESYEGPRVTCKDDKRITPFGHWLRDTKINELPQLWNVLRGDMSFVGPRPEDPAIVKQWVADAREEILSVRPGITSPASVLYHDEEALLSSTNVMSDYFKSILPDKMRLDRLYVRNHTFFADLDIIFWTIAILIPRVVKMPIRESYLFAGPLSRLMDRHISWFLLDLIVTFGAGSSAVLLWRVQGPLNWGIGNLLILSSFMAFLFSGINALAGLNRIVWSEAITEDAGGLIVSAACATLITLGLNQLQLVYSWLAYPALPITMLFTIGLMASIGFVAVRYRWRLIAGMVSRWLNWRKPKRFVERVLIVGSGEGNNVANWLLRQGDGSRLLKIVGMVDDNQPARQGMRIKGNAMLGGFADIPAIIRHHDAGVVIFALPNAPLETQRRIEKYCKQGKVRLVYLSDMLATLQKQLTLPTRQHEMAQDKGQI